MCLCGDAGGAIGGGRFGAAGSDHQAWWGLV